MSTNTLEQQMFELIAASHQAKNAGDYWAADLMISAMLHLITRGGRALMPRIFRRWFYAEVESNPDGSGYYDLLAIRAGGRSVCIPLPMLREEVVAIAYNALAYVERGQHYREHNPDLPDTWTDSAIGGLLRMGEEALPLWFNDDGLAEIEARRGRRVGERVEFDDDPVDNDGEF
jgi:hypothetical protein